MLEEKTSPKKSSAATPLIMEGQSIYYSLISSLWYPLQGPGILSLVLLGVFFYFSMWIPIMGWLMGLGVLGYAFSFFYTIISHTAGGMNQPPQLPEYSDPFEDAIKPLILTLGTFLFYFAPFYYVNFTSPQITVLHYITLGIGLFFLPMAMLAIAIYRTFAALNPILQIQAISAILPQYLGILAFLFFAVFAIILASPLLTPILMIPVVNILVIMAYPFYILAVLSRILGLIYYYYKDKLPF
ncbi:MAG: hypothetical protein D6785_16725 [Planctomycetota bacterium]|nr:MAG: hypothetical protein D6785_16725 [Planctomycetota bacterium]